MENLPQILVIDDEPTFRDGVGRVLEKSGYPFETAEDGTSGLAKLHAGRFDVVLLDLKLPDIPGLEVLAQIVQEYPDVLVVIVTGHATLENAVSTLKSGAADFLAKPFSPNELRGLLTRLSRQVELKRENEYLRRRITGVGDDQMIIGDSRPMREILSLVDKVAPTDSTVLILGESGTGKEIIARAIHERSRRSEQEFVPIDCTSLVETLLESELFGHVKGSFTGAVQTKHGYFELATGGTIFFDEVGNLPLSIQAKLLRVLQTRQFSPVGSTSTISAEVRILAATNQDLEAHIASGQFREDLFYRINVVPVNLPPLRKRADDIPPLVEYFLKRHNRRRNVPIDGVSPEAMAVLLGYTWPGNIRELENTIERALILEESDVLTVKSLPIQTSAVSNNLLDGRPLALAEIEKQHIRYVLNLVGGNRSKAARLLGVDRKTLYNKISKYDI
jgi:two-component system, NtrC family, response regulator HydG